MSFSLSPCTSTHWQSLFLRLLSAERCRPAIHGQSPHSARHWRCCSAVVLRCEMPPIQSTDNLRTPPSHWRCLRSAIHRGEMPPIDSTDNLRTLPVTGGACRRSSSTERCRLAIHGQSPCCGLATSPESVHRPVPSHWRCFSSAIHRGGMPPIESTGNLRTLPITGSAPRRSSTVVRCRPAIHGQSPHSAQSLAVLADGRPPL
jgi:hypothetical protein